MTKKKKEYKSQLKVHSIEQTKTGDSISARTPGLTLLPRWTRVGVSSVQNETANANTDASDAIADADADASARGPKCTYPSPRARSQTAPCAICPRSHWHLVLLAVAARPSQGPRQVEAPPFAV